MQKVDWNSPIEAAPRDGSDPQYAAVDREYHRKPNYVPVKLHRNLWTGQSDGHHVGGTWYFTDYGISVSGVDAGGTDTAKFTIRNKV